MHRAAGPQVRGSGPATRGLVNARAPHAGWQVWPREGPGSRSRPVTARHLGGTGALATLNARAACPTRKIGMRESGAAFFVLFMRLSPIRACQFYLWGMLQATVVFCAQGA